MRAWDPALFGLGATDLPVDVLTADETTVDGRFAARESFVYFLPEAMCDRVARLDFDPAPRVVKRAFAVWSGVRASGSSH